MRHLTNPLFYLFMLFIGAAACLDASAQTTFTSGANSTSNSNAVLWFKPAATTDWVVAHYNTGAGQQNVQMIYSAATTRFELPVTASAGQQITASFTYAISGLAYDSPSQTVVVGGAAASSIAATSSSRAASSTSAASSATSSATGIISANVDDKTTSVVIWLKPNGATVGWVEVHYILNGGAQQNVRMAYSTGTARYEQSVTVTGAANLSYSFTYDTPTGAQDSGTYSYTRPLASSSSVSSNSVASSVKSSVSSAMVSSSAKTSSSVASVASSSVASIASSSKSSTPVASSISSATSSSKISSSATYSSSSSAASSSDYSVAIAEVGGNVTFKFTANVNQTRADGSKNVTFHYYLNRDTGHQDNPAMALVSENGSQSTWSYQVKSVAPGTVITYGFTYLKPAVGGNWDSPFNDFVAGKNIGAIPAPVMYPAPGVYTADKQVTLSVNNGAAIYYTTDGSLPTQETATLYSSPINVTLGHGVWIQAIAINAQGTSAIAEGGYSIEAPLTSLAAPTFSHLTGTYATVIRPTLAHPIEGVEVYYTTNGQDPEPITGVPVLGTDGKPINKTLRYTKALEILINDDHPDGKWQVKAIAVKNGVKSPVAAVNYTVTTKDAKTDWNGLTTFKVANNSNGKWKDSEVYWAIIGKDWTTGNFVWVDKDGKQVQMAFDDSVDKTADGKVNNPTANPQKTYIKKAGDTNKLYANYFHKLSELSQVQIQAIDSARMMVSYGNPMYISTNKVADPASVNYGKIAYAGANVEDPNDPNVDVFFDFMEFAIVPKTTKFIGGIFINNTRVDMFGFPVQVAVTGEDGFKQTVGESFRESRADIFARFKAEATPEFGALIKAYDPSTPPFRILAPAHDSDTFGVIWADEAKTVVKKQGIYHTYYDNYIKAVWDQWKTNELTLALDGGWTFKGQVNGNNEFIFKNVDPIIDPATDPGVYGIWGMPSTQDVFLGNGKLDDNSNQNKADTSIGRMKQLQIQAQVCAAINRHVAHLDPSNWHNAALFFPTGEVSNWYDKLSRAHSLEALSYGFAYSDVGEQSSSIYTWSPKTVTFTVGW